MLFDDKPAESGNFQKNSWTAESDPHDGFSAVSLSAVFALAAALFSLLYLVNHSLWPVSVGAFCITLWAFWRIRRAEGRLTGVALARAALFILLVPLTAVPIQSFFYRHELVRQARAFFPLVIGAAQKGDTLALSQFLRYQTSREQIADEAQYWRKQLDDPLAGVGVVSLLRNQVLLVLCNLGENTHVTYAKTVGVSRNDKHDTDAVCILYAVTFSEHGEKKTFFVPFYGTRLRDKKSGAALWKCSKYASRPLPLEGTPE